MQEIKWCPICAVLKLNPSNSKEFRKSLKYLNKQSSSIPTLNHNGSEYCADPEKANVLNSYFNKRFNHTVPLISPLPSNDDAVYTCSPDILCTVEEVQHVLQKLERLIDLMPFPLAF